MTWTTSVLASPSSRAQHASQKPSRAGSMSCHHNTRRCSHEHAFQHHNNAISENDDAINFFFVLLFQLDVLEINCKVKINNW